MAMCGQEELELSLDGSHYSLSTGILPSLGAKSNRRVKLRPLIISPYDRRYRYYLSFLFILFFNFIVFNKNTMINAPSNQMIE